MTPGSNLNADVIPIELDTVFFAFIGTSAMRLILRLEYPSVTDAN
ncbi:hypothetical protein MGWOODY_XGa1461 [hydrothermal vent metagenome]|uniref:Uncharacterized protein n=1 Tax=hydrothermal vent metagenome TaxID=652676 RepID=A0A170PRQ5_9ZZZZ